MKMRKTYLTIYIVILYGLSGYPSFASEDGQGVILGSCATHPIENYNRTKNIEQALNKLQGRVISPGKVFSFNWVVGPRTVRRGFLPAPVLFQDKKSIQIGGGICQVSSTLYNAVLLAGLEVSERYRHSSPINYLPLGLDATVVYGYKDLKFKNIHPFPIYIMTSLTENTMTITIIGKEKLSYDVELVTQVTEIESPFPGSLSETGKEVMRYRIKRKEGVVIEKEYLGRDYYHPVKGN